jgi:hypothetical protein
MIETFLNKISKLIPADKVLHSFYGNLIYSIVFLTLVFFITITEASILALLTTLIIAFGKEVYDYINSDKHTSDIFDLVATAIQPTITTLIIYVGGILK